MDSYLVFDIETMPDIALLRRIHHLPDAMADHEVLAWVTEERKQQGLSSFLPPHFHQVVAIAVLWQQQDELILRALAEPTDDEQVLLRQFFGIIDKYHPVLISWNGGSFDLPVMQIRALAYPIQAMQYWDQGRRNSQNKFNHYRNRYHDRHLDLMDVLANYHPRQFVALDQLCALLQLPGKMGQSGAEVQDKMLAGQIDEVRDYCCLDVANTYLVWLHWARQSGWITLDAFQKKQQQLVMYLETLPHPQWRAFLASWDSKPAN